MIISTNILKGLFPTNNLLISTYCLDLNILRAICSNFLKLCFTTKSKQLIFLPTLKINIVIIIYNIIISISKTLSIGIKSLKINELNFPGETEWIGKTESRTKGILIILIILTIQNYKINQKILKNHNQELCKKMLKNIALLLVSQKYIYIYTC